MLTYLRADRANEAILDQLVSQSNGIKDWRKQIEARFDRIENILATSNGAPAISGSTNENVKVKSDHHRPAGLESLDHKPKDQQITQPLGKMPSGSDGSPHESHVTVATSLSAVGPVTLGALNVPDVPVAIEHTTAASLNEDYVMNLEAKKEVLRMYGRGEGQDSWNGGHPSSPSSGSSSGRSDELLEAQSLASSPDGIWGSGLADTKAKNERGGLRAYGSLILDHLTLQCLLKSYLDHVHILHPFLNKNTLHQMVETFSATYNGNGYRQRWSSVSATPTNPYGRAETFGTLHKPRKRKHLDVQFQVVPEPSPTPNQPFT